MFTISWIQEKISQSDYYFSQHGDRERQNDNLSISEVEEALLQSRILEYYPDTGRGESCLVVGFTDDGKPIHVVCGRQRETGESRLIAFTSDGKPIHAVCGQQRETLAIITLYIPSPPKFKNPFERG